MKISGNFIIDAPREEVWKIFMDPQQLGSCVPGCESIQVISPTKYEAVMVVKVQFMTIKFKATGELKESVEMEQLRVEMVGQPFALAGLFRAQLMIDLNDVEERKTRIVYEMDLQMTGRLASLGEILMRGTIERSANEFAGKVQQLFTTTHSERE